MIPQPLRYEGSLPEMPEIRQRFHLLRLCATIFHILAVLFILGGLVLTGLRVFVLSTIGTYDLTAEAFVPTDPDIGLAAGYVLIGFTTGLILIALAELIQVQLAREENQRITNELLLRFMMRR